MEYERLVIQVEEKQIEVRVQGQEETSATDGGLDPWDDGQAIIDLVGCGVKRPFVLVR